MEFSPDHTGAQRELMQYIMCSQMEGPEGPLIMIILLLIIIITNNLIVTVVTILKNIW